MTTAQVVETSVTVNNNSPIQDYVHPDDETQPTFVNYVKESFPWPETGPVNSNQGVSKWQSSLDLSGHLLFKATQVGTFLFLNECQQES